MYWLDSNPTQRQLPLLRARFDTVFGPESDNSAVAAAVALPLVGPALSGVNGTIFAYGVTSSGKTHTMMGTETVRERQGKGGGEGERVKTVHIGDSWGS